MARPDDKFSDREASERTEKALRAAFSTPHKTYEESKIGKKRGSARAKPRPASRKKSDNRR